MAEQTGPELTEKDSQKFINAVREAFEEERWRYLDFLKLMRAFKAKRINISTLTECAKELLKERPGLLLLLNDFLPKEYEITSIDGNDQLLQELRQNLDKVIDLIVKVELRFQDDMGVFRSFVNAMQKFRDGGMPEQEALATMYKEVSELFKDHPDLMEDFTQCLPETFQKSDTHTPRFYKEQDD